MQEAEGEGRHGGIQKPGQEEIIGEHSSCR